MKLEINRKEFIRALNRLQGIMTEKNFSYIHLIAEKNFLTISGYDRIITIASKIKCEHDSDGYIKIENNLISQIAKELNCIKLVLYKNSNNKLTIKSSDNQKFFMEIPCVENNKGRMPMIKSFDHWPSIKISSSSLSYMLNQIEYCIENDASRSYGSVAYFHKFSSDHFRIVSSDGFRLAYTTCLLNMEENFLQEGICLSKKALIDLKKMANEEFHKITLRIDKECHQLIAEVDSYQISVRASAIEYPKYIDLIPTEIQDPIVVNTTSLLHSIKRLLIVADVTKSLHLSFLEKTLTISTKDEDRAKAEEIIVIEKNLLGKREFNIIGTHLTDVLSRVIGESVSIYINELGKSILLSSNKEPLNHESLSLIVPIIEKEYEV